MSFRKKFPVEIGPQLQALSGLANKSVP